MVYQVSYFSFQPVLHNSYNKGHLILSKRYLATNWKEEMFYLTTHSTYFIYGYMEGRKEGNVLFNVILNTFYGYMASDIW